MEGYPYRPNEGYLSITLRPSSLPLHNGAGFKHALTGPLLGEYKGDSIMVIRDQEHYCSKCGWRLEEGRAGKEATCWNCVSQAPSCSGCGKLLPPRGNCPTCTADAAVRVRLQELGKARSRYALQLLLTTSIREFGIGTTWQMSDVIASDGGWRGRAADDWSRDQYNRAFTPKAKGA